jgi:endonuclease YncB( thermonuclease family)
MQERINNTVFLRHSFSLLALTTIHSLMKAMCRTLMWFSLVFFLLCLLRSHDTHAVGNEEAIVSHVIDGDSLELKQDGRTYQARLWGIDTPEYDQDFAEKAKNYTRWMVEEKTVAFSRKYTDRFDRVVVMAWVNGTLLNEELVKKGLAWVHVRYCDEEICQSWRDLEQEARKKRIGIWQDDRPVPPWQWKSRQRREKTRRD